MGSETRRHLTEMKTDPELLALLAQAKERWAAMSPEEKIAMRRAQRRSWVVGNMMLDHPELSREYVEKIYDKIEQGDA